MFYRDVTGKTPVTEFLDTLQAKQAQKVTWVLKLIEDVEQVPKTYFKKLVNTNDIWEVRIQFGNNIFRILCFQEAEKLVVLTNGFTKKTQRTPRNEIELAEIRKQDWIRRNRHE